MTTTVIYSLKRYVFYNKFSRQFSTPSNIYDPRFFLSPSSPFFEFFPCCFAPSQKKANKYEKAKKADSAVSEIIRNVERKRWRVKVKELRWDFILVLVIDNLTYFVSLKSWKLLLMKFSWDFGLFFRRKFTSVSRSSIVHLTAHIHFQVFICHIHIQKLNFFTFKFRLSVQLLKLKTSRILHPTSISSVKFFQLQELFNLHLQVFVEFQNFSHPH